MLCSCHYLPPGWPAVKAGPIFEVQRAVSEADSRCEARFAVLKAESTREVQLAAFWG